MIIDALVRFWNGPEQLGPELARSIRDAHANAPTAIDASAEGIHRAIAPLGGAFVMGLQSQSIHASVPNEHLAELVRRGGGRLLGASGIDPTSAGALADFERSRSLGLLGVCVSPSTQQFHPTHSAAMRLFDRCQELGVPVFASRPGLFSRSSSMEFDRPSAWDEVVRSLPRLKLVIGEMGWPWVDEGIALASKSDNVFLATDGLVRRPWMLYTTIMTASSVGILDRLLFASGFPFESPSRAVEAVYAAGTFVHGTQLPPLPRAALRSIVERDAFQALGIPSLSPPPPTARPIFGFPGSIGDRKGVTS
ncbi:MAG: amidohydrolase family protein [Planctomycetota bacterium]|nr:amidohydrolase family protein [Planctomycetota bacterium]